MNNPISIVISIPKQKRLNHPIVSGYEMHRGGLWFTFMCSGKQRSRAIDTFIIEHSNGVVFDVPFSALINDF